MKRGNFLRWESDWTKLPNPLLEHIMKTADTADERCLAGILRKSYGNQSLFAVKTSGSREIYTRDDLAKDTSLDKSTVSRACARLVAKGYIREEQVGKEKRSYPIAEPEQPELDENVAPSPVKPPIMAFIEEVGRVRFPEQYAAYVASVAAEKVARAAKLENLNFFVNLRDSVATVATESDDLSCNVGNSTADTSATESAPILITERKLKKTTTAAPANAPPIQDALGSYGVVVDPKATIKKLMAECRKAVRNCTEGEIVAAIHGFAAEADMRNAKNPVGLLLTRVPLYLAAHLKRQQTPKARAATAGGASTERRPCPACKKLRDYDPINQLTREELIEACGCQR